MYNEKMRQSRANRSGTFEPDTIRSMHNVLHGALKQAEKNQLVVRNVSTLVGVPYKERREM
jgi:hypothetical protein